MHPSPGAEPRSLSPFVPGQGDGPTGADPGAAAPGPAAPGTAVHWFLFRDGKMLVADDGADAGAGGAAGAQPARATVPFTADLSALGLHPRRAHFLGTAAGSPCFAAEVPAADPVPGGWAFHGLRSLFSSADEVFFRVAGRAAQVLDWDRSHKFCGGCGAPTVEKPGERAKVCPVCGQTSYPRISPAVIVAVSRGDEILLARASRFVEGMYSVLAGFVEPGETLEECVHREVHEETGIEVTGVRYVASQPWPFPNSLMVGFTAEYLSGDLVIDRAELDDARWFRADSLPRIPGRITIARRLIDGFVEARRG